MNGSETSLRKGLFFTEDVSAVRDEWLAEGVVPRCNVQGFRSFNSIIRECEEGGDCVVKQQPMFFDDIQDFMKKWKWNIGEHPPAFQPCSPLKN